MILHIIVKAHEHTSENCFAFLLLMVSLNISCRLSLQYHPDKNKNKAAQEKFAEINNGKENFHFLFFFNQVS